MWCNGFTGEAVDAERPRSSGRAESDTADHLAEELASVHLKPNWRAMRWIWNSILVMQLATLDLKLESERWCLIF